MKDQTNRNRILCRRLFTRNEISSWREFLALLRCRLQLKAPGMVCWVQGQSISGRCWQTQVLVMLLVVSVGSSLRAEREPRAELFLGGTVFLPQIEDMPVTQRGIAIPVGPEHQATLLFDTELLRMSGVWQDGFLAFHQHPFGMGWGTYRAVGELIAFTYPRFGWSMAGSFTDPRARPAPDMAPGGPLPREQGHYRGLYVYEDRVILSYRVGQTGVLESPGAESRDDLLAVIRTIELSAAHPQWQLLVCEAPRANAELRDIDGVLLATFTQGEMVTAVGAVGSAGVRLSLESGSQVVLTLPKCDTVTRAKIFLWKGKPELLGQFVALVKESAAPIHLEPLTHGGPAQAAAAFEVVRGTLGVSQGAYAVDTLPLPEYQAWGGPMHSAAINFFDSGDAVVAFLEGQVWLLKGISDTLDSLSWQPYASGLYQTGGVEVIDGVVYVAGRDRITRLQDLNQDGQADFYENFNQDWVLTEHEHEFVVGLDGDQKGCLYLIKGGPLEDPPVEFKRRHQGCLLRVSPDGQRLDVVATGFRSVLGVSVGPEGQLTCSDQEGCWTPTTRLNWVRPGGFYGFVPAAYRQPTPVGFDPPICWIPKVVDNSGAGQFWVEDDRWGPFQGQMLHLSYGKCQIFLVLQETVAGRRQGGVVALPVNFDSGLMDAEFRPQDGQLYLCGQRGWMTSGAKENNLVRLRYVGGNVYLPSRLEIVPSGVRLKFHEALDREWASDPDNYAVEQWSYRWTSQYGSKEYKVSDENSEGHDEVEVLGATLSEDGKSILLELEEVFPVMQMKIQYELRAADGLPVQGEIFNTIHQIPP